MNENIDLTEILKECPIGTKLYHAGYGDVWFCGIDLKANYPIRLSFSNDLISNTVVTSKGTISRPLNGECLLFPSKDQRDWSKFTAPWYKKEKLVELKESDDEKIRMWIIDDIRYNMDNEPLNNSEYKKKAEKAIAWLENQGEQNLPSANERTWLYLVSDVLTWKYGIGQYLDNPEVQEIAKRLCNKYAQKLYNPSALSNSLNTGKNEQKFDPNTLKPFDKVLCRNGLDIWRCDFFSSYNGNRVCPNVCIGGSYLCCIPYNDDTKHLVGTTEDAPEFYRYWED